MRLHRSNKRKTVSTEKLRKASLLIVNTLILSFIYFGSMNLDKPILSAVVTVGFWVSFAGFLLAYVIYNRGFTRKNVTVEMLPEHWSDKKKKEYIENGNSRYERSRWMLSIIIALMVPIMLDAVILFTWPIIQRLLGLN